MEYHPLPMLNLVAWTIVNFARDLNFTGFYWGYLVMVGTADLAYFIFSLVNAFTVPGGNILISAGLISFCDTPQELAALMYHPAEDFKAVPVALDWEEMKAGL